MWRNARVRVDDVGLPLLEHIVELVYEWSALEKYVDVDVVLSLVDLMEDTHNSI